MMTQSCLQTFEDLVSDKNLKNVTFIVFLAILFWYVHSGKKPLFIIVTFSKDLSDNHVFIFRTLWRRKCGRPARRDFLDEVNQPNNLAYKQRWNETENRMMIAGSGFRL